MLFRILDILKVAGINTLRWCDELAKKVLKPRGDSRSTLMNTGFAVVPDLIS
jgi:hypothetical protein